MRGRVPGQASRTVATICRLSSTLNGRNGNAVAVQFRSRTASSASDSDDIVSTTRTFGGSGEGRQSRSWPTPLPPVARLAAETGVFSTWSTASSNSTIGACKHKSERARNYTREHTAKFGAKVRRMAGRLADELVWDGTWDYLRSALPETEWTCVRGREATARRKGIAGDRLEVASWQTPLRV
eukprot:229089-Pleurochrysis_carterae.AAC.1